MDLKLRLEHQKYLLRFSWVGCLTAAALFVFTIMTYNYLYYPHLLVEGLWACVPPAGGCLLLFKTLRTNWIKKHYQFPIFLILAIFATYAASVNMQLTGGGKGSFFFPFFLIFIGIAVYYPAELRWVVATCLIPIGGYISSELWMGRNIFSESVGSNIVYLIDAAVLCLVGNRIFYRLFIHDKKNQIALEEANERLKELDRAKSLFFANISHELKTPVTLVMAPVETALPKLSKDSPKFMRETLETVRHNAHRLSELINDLLSLTEANVGKSHANPTEIHDTHDYFKSMFQSAIPLIEDKKIQYELKMK